MATIEIYGPDLGTKVCSSIEELSKSSSNLLLL